jgi:hypothetical protein
MGASFLRGQMFNAGAGNRKKSLQETAVLDVVNETD